MSLTMITSALARGANRISLDAWAADEDMRAQKVALFRQYAEGDHRANLTSEMRAMLRIRNTGSLNEFNANYCQVIPDTMNDRLQLTGIDADNDTAREWAANILKDNRIDALQTDIHNAALVDADTYVLVDMEQLPDGTRRVRLTHEEAYDGTYGMLVHYETTTSKTPLFAVRIWRVTREQMADTIRVNVYYANRIERFISSDIGGSLVPYEDDGQASVLAWTMDGTPNGTPIGVPVVPFRNRGKQRGVSEIENVVPLQDILNRTLYSMVSTAELLGFPIRGVVGTKMPAAIVPGMTLSVYTKDPNGNPGPAATEMAQKWLDGIRFLEFKQATLEPFISQAEWVIDQIFDITNTPRERGGAGDSGETLKQREIGLIGKVERFQVKAGNSWEDVIELAWRVQQAYGAEKPPEYEAFTAKWKPAQIRNDKEVIDTIMRLYNNGGGIIDLQTALEEIAPLFDWNEEKQAVILQRMMMQQAQQRAQEAVKAGGQAPPEQAAQKPEDAELMRAMTMLRDAA